MYRQACYRNQAEDDRDNSQPDDPTPIHLYAPYQLSILVGERLDQLRRCEHLLMQIGHGSLDVAKSGL